MVVSRVRIFSGSHPRRFGVTLNIVGPVGSRKYNHSSSCFFNDIYVFSLIWKAREEKRPLHGLLFISLPFIRHDILQGSQKTCYFGSATIQELNIKQGKKQMF